MAINRGKDFENVVRESLNKVPNTSVIRLPDPTNGYLGIRNISDFVVYHFPHQYFIECKSVHGNLFPLSNITQNQWGGMVEVSRILGVNAGVIVWWVDKDVTRYIPIQTLVNLGSLGKRSVRYDLENENIIDIPGTKKRVFFDYDMSVMFKEYNDGQRAGAESK